MFERRRIIVEFDPPKLRKEETRRTLFWIKRIGEEAFLINDSYESLTYVRASSSGFTSSEDNAHMLEAATVIEYQDVLPGEAVKVEEYDEFYDLDYILQIHIQLQSLSFGVLNMLTEPAKGGAKDQVLLWQENILSIKLKFETGADRINWK